MDNIQAEISSSLRENGVALVGFADISELPETERHFMNSAITFAVDLDAGIIHGIADGPTLQYHKEYLRVNNLLSKLCESTVTILKKHGIETVSIAPTILKVDYGSLRTQLPHKTVATRAGLGWIGKSALIITEKYGAAVRLATVLCNIEFETGKPINRSRCGDCIECVIHCPANAITGNHWKAGLKRKEIFNARACYGMAKELSGGLGIQSTICGICVNVCPWTQKYIKRAFE